jgi:hypothetical protein
MNALDAEEMMSISVLVKRSSTRVGPFQSNSQCAESALPSVCGADEPSPPHYTLWRKFQ